MTTIDLIRLLKMRTHNYKLVCYKYALFSIMFNRHLSISDIAKTTGFQRSSVNYGINTLKNLLDIDDFYAKVAYDELKNHTIEIEQQITLTSNGIANISYKLTIDNLNYNDYGNN